MTKKTNGRLTNLAAIVGTIGTITIGLSPYPTLADCGHSLRQPDTRPAPVTIPMNGSAYGRRQPPGQPCDDTTSPGLRASLESAPLASGYPWRQNEKGKLAESLLHQPADELTLSITRGGAQIISVRLQPFYDTLRRSDNAAADGASTTNGASLFGSDLAFNSAAVSTRIQILTLGRSRLGVDFAKDDYGTKKGITFTVIDPDSAARRFTLHGTKEGITFTVNYSDPATQRFVFQGKLLRPKDGRSQYLIGLASTRAYRSHKSTFSLGLGETGGGGIGTRLDWQLRSYESNSSLEASTAVGDDGFQSVFRVRYSF